MPYEKLSDLPDEVRALPRHAQEIWMAAFNAAIEQYEGDEEKAFATAWAAVKQKYRKEGDRWVAREGEHMEGKWIPIFRTGRHTDSAGNEKDWTEEDLDQIVSSYNPAEHEAPIVIGHPSDNAPAYGWTAALKREGEILFAKFKQLVPEFVDMVQRGLFKKRSIALYPDLTLRHIGFLGAMPPAVKGLADVGFKHGQVATIIEFEDIPQRSFEDLVERLERVAEIIRSSWMRAFAATDEEKAAQKARSRRYGIGIKEGGNVTKPSEWDHVADDDFLDPVNYRYPCPDADQTRAAASYWGKPANQAQYSSQERAVINRRLDAKRKKFKIGEQSKKGGHAMSVKEKLSRIFSRGLEGLPDDDPLLQPDEPRTFTEAEVKAEAERKAEEARKAERQKVDQEYAEKDKKARLEKKEGEVNAFVEDLKKKGHVIPAWDKMGLSKFMESLDDEEGHEFAEGTEKISQLAFMRKFLEELPKAVTFGEIATRDKDVADADEEKRELLIEKYQEQHKGMSYKEAVLAVSKKHPDLFKSKE